MRIGLFLITNLAVMFVLSIVLSLFGLGGTENHLGLIIFASVFGFGGAFVSLMMSKSMAIRSVKARIIEKPESEIENWLMEKIELQAESSGIPTPQFAIFESQSPNAFATGASKNNSLVAVSTGLLSQMDRDEVEAVLAHEISHVANGDMVTLTLLQGVMNTFVMVFAHILAAVIDKGRGRGMGYFMGYFVAQSVLGFLASLILMWFSRFREYRADSGGAELASKQKMIKALKKLESFASSETLPKEVEAFAISGGMNELLSTHPPLDKRIKALEDQ